jgi:NADPH-dependent F420 reductase
MQIGIIGGTGHEGRGIAARFAAAGLSVLIGSRDAGRAQDTVNRLHGASATLPVEGLSNDEVAARSDILFLAVPFEGLGELLQGLRSRLRRGACVVDLVVPVTFEDGIADVISVPEGSATEFVRAHLPPEVQVAGAFKTIPAGALGRLDAPLDCDEFVCGDTPEVRERVIGLLSRIPALRPLDAGGLASARAIERMTVLGIALNKRYKVRDSRFRVVGIQERPEIANP